MKFDFLNKKFFTIISLALLLFLAFFVRTYNFGDWLYFKMDQARDAQLISHAIKGGPELLPLLGPRAGATEVDSGYLRLGPAYYYFQYLSGKIFNSTSPEIFAYPDLFFSVLAIALLYFFARIYFNRNVSLLITAMYAFSFLVIQYSRFAWNPNSLQFFTLLTFFGLIKFLNEESKGKKLFWLATWSLSLSIGSQLHFFGFFMLLGSSGLLILAHNKLWNVIKIIKIFKPDNLKKIFYYALVSVSVFAVIYIPVIASDVMRGGENLENFIHAFSSKPSDKPLPDKVIKNLDENAKYYCLVATSFCNKGSVEDNLVPAIFSAALIIFGLMLAVRAKRKEPSGIKGDFLNLLLIWAVFFFILTIPVSFDLRPRFFILVFAVPFVLAGIIFEFFSEKWPRRSPYLIFIILSVIIGSNAYGTWAWFREQKLSQIKSADIGRTLILKAKDGVTLGQLQKAADFIYAKRKNKNRIHYYVKPEHIAPIKYLLREKDPTLEIFTLKDSRDPQGQYFAVTPAHSGIAPLTQKYGEIFEVIDQRQFGQIMVAEVKFSENAQVKNFRFNKEKSKTDRLFWKDVFNSKGTALIDDIYMDE